MNPPEVVGAVVIGVIAGVISGALGVGGGIVMVPAMVLLMGMGQATAQGTSLVVILPTALSGAYTHYRHGLVLRRSIIMIGLVGALAAAGGGYLALHLDAQVLRRVFGAYLLLVGLRFLLTARS
jgi:uncharacterized membrane protein YfcA